jgi:hypothetical protein
MLRGTKSERDRKREREIYLGVERGKVSGKEGQRQTVVDRGEI